MKIVETAEMSKCFESFRRAMDEMKDNAGTIAERRRLRALDLDGGIDSPMAGETRAA
jgi:hypothetical protein